MTRLRSWQLISVMLAPLALAAFITAVVFLPQALSEGGRGTLGYLGTASRFAGSSAHLVVGFQPGSPLPAAGVVEGDLLLKPLRGRLTEGQPVQLQVAHGEQVRGITVSAVARPPSVAADVGVVFETALAVVTLLLGTLLILRRWRDETALTLGSFMLIAVGGMCAMEPPVGVLAATVDTWYTLALALAIIVMTWVALVMTRPTGRTYQWIARGCLVLTAALFGSTILIGLYFFGFGVPAVDFLLNTVRPALQAVALVLCVVAFVRTWRHVEAEQRERLRWLFVGFGVGLLAIGLTVALIGGVFGTSEATYVWVSLFTDVLAAFGLGILAYAILRQRVLDVGFAINRAIVYALLTGLMLVGFGLVEWFVDHVLEFEERKKSVWLDGALALGIFLVFHRLQHWLSHNVQRLFFRSWHAKERELRRFLELSEHFTDADALGKALLDALDSYTESFGSALYERDAQGRFVLARATLPGATAAFGANEPLVVRMKASFGKPVAVEVSAAPHAETWAFPLTRRGELVGFIRIGEKRSHDVYRPDQIEHVARAVRQVGSDLYVLRLERAANNTGLTVVEPTPHPLPST